MRVVIFVFCVCKLGLAGEDTGYPAGLLAECPGMTKNTTLSEKTKSSLTVVVLWASNNLIGSKETICKLNTNAGAACVAEHLDLRKKKTVILISGYLDSSFSPIVRIVATPYIKNGYNVIIMEIFPILHNSYPISARLTRPLGISLGEFLAELTYRGLEPNNLELLGGSLGAHIAYYAATRYHELTRHKPARLTGLDPAGPCFRTLSRSQRFNSDAAHRVDAVHTNVDGFGIADAIAHVDFYVNGGEFQPAMINDYLVPCFQLCSHVRAAIYWLVAYNEPDQFLGVRCPSVPSARHGNCYQNNVQVNVLGPKTNFSKPGIYYLPTLEILPFYMGKKGLKERKLGVNSYLYKITDDKDIVV